MKKKKRDAPDYMRESLQDELWVFEECLLKGNSNLSKKCKKKCLLLKYTKRSFRNGYGYGYGTQMGMVLQNLYLFWVK